MKWHEFYDQEITRERYNASVEGFLAPYLDAIQKYAGGQRGLEAGCAEGLASIYLSSIGYEITAVDLDERLLEKARNANDMLGGKAEFFKADLFRLDELGIKVDFVFSQGVLEHYSPKEIRALLEKQLAIAGRVIFSVPSIRHGKRDFGDENLWSYSEWVEILRGFNIIHSFGFHPRMGRIAGALMFPLYFIAPGMRLKIKKRFFDTQLGFVLGA